MWNSIKVIELASVLAGPLVGSFFAELGAQVIKIENKKAGGDVTRQWKLKQENKDDSFSAYYASANYGKEILLLDLSNPDDYDTVIALIKDADIVIENFKASVAKKLKVDGESLQAINPALIVGSITGFGNSDKRMAYDVVLQAETGYMFMNREAEQIPLKMPVAMIDILAAHHLKQAILIALYERAQTQQGKIVSVSLYDAALANLANQSSGYLMANQVPQAMGSKHPNIAPYGDMFKTADDKYIVLAVGSNTQFAHLCKVLELDLLIEHENFNTNQQRVLNRAELCQYLEQKISTLATTELMPQFLKYEVPAGQVKNLAKVFEDKKAQELIQEFIIDGSYKAKRIKTLLQ